MSSAPSEEAGGSRLTNRNNSVNSSTAGISASEREREIPTPEERISEFYAEYQDRATLPLTEVDGRRLRRDLVDEGREEHIIEVGENEDRKAKVTSVTERRPRTWGEAVEELLESHEDARRTTLNLEKGRTDDSDYEAWSTDAEDRWTASYQKRYFAQMNGWLREMVGGERPSGGECDGQMDDPHLALLTRSASAAPEGKNLPPADHEAALRDSWEPVYHTLRNTMRALGFTLGEDWQYDRRSEPHKGERGGGLNHCYGHEHVVLVVDGEVTADDLAPVVSKHVETCDLAGEDAHGLDDALEIKRADEMSNVAAYCADYCGIEPKDLLERDIEYVAWAATKHATNARTLSRSDAASNAATADACKQRAESGQSEQDRDHGERVVRSERRGYEYECAACGSPHGVPQDHDTLASARLDESSGSGEAVADGGIDRKRELAQRWPSARAAASVGEGPTDRERRREIEAYLDANPEASVAQVLGALGLPERAGRLVVEVRLGADVTEPVAFERPPRWRLRSVTVGEEEYPASPGGGVDMIEVELPERRVREEFGLDQSQRYRCECGVAAYGDTMCSHLLAVHGVDRAYSSDLVSLD